MVWKPSPSVMCFKSSVKLDTIFDYADKAQLLAPQQLEMAGIAQARRNAVHAFRDREIGILPDFLSAVRCFRIMLLTHNPRTPYPDRHASPSEIPA